MSDELRFEMDRLVSYDDASLVSELQRVSEMVSDGPLTVTAYDTHSRASSSAVRKRFGGWQKALERAGLGHRYAGTKVTSRMREQKGRTVTADEIVAELQRVSAVVGRRRITMEDLSRFGDLVSVRAVLSRFGSWKSAIAAADLELSSRARRYSEDDYFENLLAVWTHYRRAPFYSEMDLEPSGISSGGYASRFGTWGKAKQAFVDRVNSDIEVSEKQELSAPAPAPRSEAPRQEDQRAVPVGLRYQVLRRDNFRCVTCGRSPATEAGCVLHVDHVLAFARGGNSRADNLRSLCESCNMGKGVGDS